MEELDVMRQQMARLEEQLEKQAIVVDKFLRGDTLKRVHHLNRTVRREGIGAAFMITIGNLAFLEFGCSWWFIASTTLLMIANFLSIFIPHRWVKEDEIISGDLLQVAQQVRCLHKWYKESLKIEIPILLGWIAWGAWEMYQNAGDSLSLDITGVRIMCISVLVGGLIGVLIALRQHKGYMREMDDIINQIEEA